MTPVLDAPLAFPLQAEFAPREPSVLLRGVAWESYLMIGQALAERPNLRLTYNCGNLEIMTTSSWHELLKTWISRVIDVLAEEFGRDFVTAGNMTFQREGLEKGIEGDNCYWFEAEAEMRTKRTWDAERDPPPELLLEIEVSRSSLSRMSIYAALGIVEVWCFDGSDLRIHQLQSDQTYKQAAKSRDFPEISPEELSVFCVPTEDVSMLAFLRNFRTWVRTHVPR